MNLPDSTHARITEAPNPLTLGIDLASPLEMVSLLEKCDRQMFAGFDDYPSLKHPEIIRKIRQSVQHVQQVLAAENGRIIISGAGTSGRLAWLICRKFNSILEQQSRRPRFYPLLAGGFRAFVKAVEGAEDDWQQGIKDLQAVLPEEQKAAYIGISCGLSAPWVAAQLDWCLHQPGVIPIALGFNPIEGARDTLTEGNKKTFKQVLEEMQQDPQAVILNPILGPEAITGSTRLKGGSATKLLLEMILSLAFKESADSSEEAILSLLKNYQRTIESTYHQRDSIAQLMSAAGESLRAGGHIYYVGSGTLGLLGLIDASECPPTFGADFEDVRGVVLKDEGGGMKDDRGGMTVEEFEKKPMGTLTEPDLVIALAKSDDTSFDTVLNTCRKIGARTACIAVNLNQDIPTVDYRVNLANPVRGGFFEELSLKLVLNAISTGAHILAGRVYRNRMIDLRISNSKLYFRSLQIIEDIMKVNSKTAKEALHRAIYMTDHLTGNQLNSTATECVRLATGRKKIVPLALLLSTGKYNLKTAGETLEKEPVVRKLIEVA